MQKQPNFTEGPILSALLKFALPVLLALFLQAMYGAVDLQVVGRFGTAADISAVSTGSQIMQSVTVVITGLAMGVTVLIGQRIGEGKVEEAGRAVGSGICLFAVVSLVLTVLMLLAAPQMAAVMRAPEDAFAGTVTYVRLCGAGTVFIVAYNILGSIFRGIGDSRMPLITVAIACALNIAGDLLLVGGFGMGVAGAAIATVFAQAASVVISLAVIRRRGLPFVFHRTYIRFEGAVTRRILQLGTPIALQDLLVSFSFLAILAIVNGMGVVVSAGVGVAEKLCGFVMLVPSAYMQSMSAFVAQNIGAGREDRARRALLCGMLSSLVAGILMWWASYFHGDILAGIFAGDDAAVIAAAWEYLKAYGIDCLLTSFLFCFIGYFNGCGQTLFVMLQGFAGAFGVRLPLALLISHLGGSLFYIGLSTPASTAVQILLCLICFGRRLRMQKNSLAQ